MKKAKGYRGKADVLFSKIIRSQGFCERCGKNYNLQTSHIISRRYSATRTLEDNAQCLCAGCHMYFTHWPKEFSRWITETIGVEKYEELKAKAEAVTKVDWKAEHERLKAKWKEIEQ